MVWYAEVAAAAGAKNANALHDKYVKIADETIKRGKDAEEDTSFYRYKKGKNTPTRTTLGKINEAFPGTIDAFTVGPWENNTRVRLADALYGSVETLRELVDATLLWPEDLQAVDYQPATMVALVFERVGIDDVLLGTKPLISEMSDADMLEFKASLRQKMAHMRVGINDPVAPTEPVRPPLSDQYLAKWRVGLHRFVSVIAVWRLTATTMEGRKETAPGVVVEWTLRFAMPDLFDDPAIAKNVAARIGRLEQQRHRHMDSILAQPPSITAYTPDPIPPKKRKS